MKITADDFWRLLPWAIDRLAQFHRHEQSFVGWKLEVRPVTVSGRRNPAPGEEIRWIIQSHSDRFVYDPLAAVIWLLTADYVGISNKNRGDRIGLDRRFARSIEAASVQAPGFSRKVRKKLLTHCGISYRYLEPTAA